MVKRALVRVGIALAALLLLPLAGCSGDDSPDEKEQAPAAEPETAVVRNFVGEVTGTEAFVAVVAAPAPGDEGSGVVEMYLSDGSGLSEWFSGPISDNGFTLKSQDGDAEAEGELSEDEVRGTVVLPGGRTLEYDATPPSGPAGLYELTVSSAGELKGASAAGLGVTGRITLGKRGTGTLRLVDGKRLEFAVTGTKAGDPSDLRAGQARLIILSGGELRGVAKTRPVSGRSDFFIRSA